MKTLILLATVTTIVAPVVAREWPVLEDQTSTRLPTPPNDPATTTLDPDEKDYAWADLDLDGDIDLVVVRKQGWTSTGRRPNVLLMNEGMREGHAVDGVLIDRTAAYASASDVPGDLGFLTPTNDRDVVIVDVNMDGWPDLVTATELTDHEPVWLSHPRVYMNLGEDGDGHWLGFRYEVGRIPEMHPTVGPRFAAVAAGDVTGDGAPDLFFTDHDFGGPEGFDYDNRLLVNDGTGFFVDETTTRLTPAMTSSSWGAAAAIADMNGDGVNEIVRQSTGNPPVGVWVLYQDSRQPGHFIEQDTVYSQSPTFVSVADLNNDGRADLIITDDGVDRYLLNQGNDVEGRADFMSRVFPSNATNGFGNNSLAPDLDGDGWLDVLITDIDMEISGCSRQLAILRNLGDAPDVSFEDRGTTIPAAQRTGTHDIAAFDLNGDGAPDLVVGRCSGTEVWINAPNASFGDPDALPTVLPPQTPTTLTVTLQPATPGFFEAVTMFVAIGDEPEAAIALTDLGGGIWSGAIPAASCDDAVTYWFAATVAADGLVITDPPGAPTTTYGAIVANGFDETLRDELEGPVDGWTVVNDASLVTGAWEVADPNSTFSAGMMIAPEDDATERGTKAFITGQGAPGEPAGTNDVDGGPTRLITPGLDLGGVPARLSFAYWYADLNGVAEPFLVDLTDDDGATWVPVASLGPTGGVWTRHEVLTSGLVDPRGTVRLRFSVADVPNDSLLEAGIDDLVVEAIICTPPCPDLDGSADVGAPDLAILLAAWGPNAGDPADLNGDDIVDAADLAALLASWGPCP